MSGVADLLPSTIDEQLLPGDLLRADRRDPCDSAPWLGSGRPVGDSADPIRSSTP